MHWVCTYLADDLYISIVVKFSCTHHGSKSLVKHSCALIESIHIYSSLSVEAACLIVQHTRQCMYTFYCLGNMLGLCAVFCLFVFSMLRENVMNCIAPNPLPLKHPMKFFCEQIELRVAPCLIDPWNFHMSFL